MDKAVVLCVDDDGTLLHALRTLLQLELGNSAWIEIAESGEEALEVCAELQAQSRPLAVVISDYIMPGMRGDELLVRLHQRYPQALKIMLTGLSDVAGVKRAINDANLYRFIEKPFDNDDLVLTTQGALKAFHQERELERRSAELQRMNAELEAQVAERTRELQQKNEALEHMAVTDRLTGLCNRHQLDETLAQEVARSHRYGDTFCVLMLDIDHFKAVNDSHGHQAGDRVLAEFAQLLRQQTRDVDIVGRWGGEEFLVVCPSTELVGAAALAEKLRAAMAAHDFGPVGHKTVSVGVAAYHGSDSVEGLMARADAALYRAKGAGRNRVELAA